MINPNKQFDVKIHLQGIDDLLILNRFFKRYISKYGYSGKTCEIRNQHTHLMMLAEQFEEFETVITLGRKTIKVKCPSCEHILIFKRTKKQLKDRNEMWITTRCDKCHEILFGLDLDKPHSKWKRI